MSEYRSPAQLAFDFYGASEVVAELLQHTVRHSVPFAGDADTVELFLRLARPTSQDEVFCCRDCNLMFARHLLPAPNTCPRCSVEPIPKEPGHVR